MNEYVVDTHPIIWYLAGNPSISLPAKKAIASVIRGKSRCYLSGVVLMEMLAYAIKTKEQELGIQEIFAFLEQHKNFIVVDIPQKHIRQLPDYLGKEVMVKKKKKKLEIHDALIMILTKEVAAPLITKDSVIHASQLVDILW